MREPSGRSEKEKMLAGELYMAAAPELSADRLHAFGLLCAYNNAGPDDDGLRASTLRKLLGAVGQGVVLRPPFYCDYGYNIRLGRSVFMNFGCVVLDCSSVEIGDDCQIGAHVQILTADHPRDPALRSRGLEFARPVRIGRNVWIGSGAILLPGISIGADAIIGAGSVVTRDVPAGVTVMGNPARTRR